MTKLKKAINDLKIALQNKPMYANKTQEKIIKLLPFIEKAQETKKVSDAILLDIVLKTMRLLDFTPAILNTKGKKYVRVLDKAYYNYPDLHDSLAIYELNRRGIYMHSRFIETLSKYSQIHDEFEELIDSVPGKRNQFFAAFAISIVGIGGMVILIASAVSSYPVMTVGILMITLGLIVAVYNYVRTGFSKQMLNVSKARQDDEKSISAKIQSGRLTSSIASNLPFFLLERDNVQSETTGERNQVLRRLL